MGRGRWKGTGWKRTAVAVIARQAAMRMEMNFMVEILIEWKA